MIDIKNKFLELTKRTYPHGTEDELFDILPNNLKTDEFGNKYIQIGETSTMFTSHLDTATATETIVNHVIEGDMIKTDGTSILGADDKAGVTIMLYMIENNIPGLYYFFLGEEVGCVGSRKLSDKFKTEKIDYITKVISFDRRDLDSVITYQASSRCCSDKFGEALAEQLNICSKQIYDNNMEFNYKIDPTGIYTDSAQFTSIYPECTNISVGYYSEHTHTERQNIKHLDKLAKTCCLVDWESLPIERDYTKKEYRSYSNYGYSNYGYSNYNDSDDWDEYYGNSYSNRNKPKEEKKYFLDKAFGTAWSSCVTTENGTNKVKSVDFSSYRIDFEKELIIELFLYLDVIYKSVTWTGEKAIIIYDGSHNFTELSRNELSEFLPELNFWEFEVERQRNEDLFDDISWIYT